MCSNTNVHTNLSKFYAYKEVDTPQSVQTEANPILDDESTVPIVPAAVAPYPLIRSPQNSPQPVFEAPPNNQQPPEAPIIPSLHTDCIFKPQTPQSPIHDSPSLPITDSSKFEGVSHHADLPQRPYSTSQTI